MSIENKFLQRLKEEQMRCADEQLTKPERSEFGYGKAHGMYIALKHVEQLFLELIGEDDDRS